MRWRALARILLLWFLVCGCGVAKAGFCFQSFAGRALTTDSPAGPLLVATSPGAPFSRNAGALRLTEGGANHSVGVWHTVAQPFADGFQASLSFTLQRSAFPPCSGASCDYGGLSLVLRGGGAATTPGASDVGGAGSGLGVAGLGHAVAVTFNWWPTRERLGLASNATGVLCVESACLFSNNAVPALTDGTLYTLAVAYDDSAQILVARLNDDVVNSLHVDLRGLLALPASGVGADVWVGITAASGGEQSIELSTLSAWSYAQGCSAGSYFDGLACQACPIGTYNPGFSTGDALSTCLLCPAGSIAPSAGAVSCDPCPLDFEADATRAFCARCGFGQSLQLSGINGSNTIACNCAAGFFINGSECDPCPLNTICTGGTAKPRALEGYWISNGVVLKCPLPFACAADNVCNPGYTGFLCAACIPSYYFDNSKCHTCTEISNYSVPLIAALFVLLLALFYGVREQLRVFAIASSFVQTVGLMATSTSVRLPAVFSNSQRYASLTSGNIRVLATVQCFFEWDYYQGWSRAYLGPLGVLMFLLALMVLRVAIGMICVGRRRCSPCCNHEGSRRIFEHLTLEERNQLAVDSPEALNIDEGRCVWCTKRRRACRAGCAKMRCSTEPCSKCWSDFKKAVPIIPDAIKEGLRHRQNCRTNGWDVQDTNMYPPKMTLCPSDWCRVKIRTFPDLLRDPAFNSLFTLMVLFAQLALVSVIARILEPLNCTVMQDGTRVITSHPQIVCHDDKWNAEVYDFFTFMPLAIFVVIYIALMSLSIWAWWTTSNKAWHMTTFKDVNDQARRSERDLAAFLRPLYGGFGKNYSWWWAAQNFIQLGISMTLIAIESAIGQYSVAMFILLFYLMLNMYFSPYAVREHSDLEAASLLFSCGLYIFGMLYAAGFTHPALDGLFLASSIIWVIILILLFVRATFFTEYIIKERAKEFNEKNYIDINAELDAEFYPIADVSLLNKLTDSDVANPADTGRRKPNTAGFRLWMGSQTGYQLYSIFKFIRTMRNMHLIRQLMDTNGRPGAPPPPARRDTAGTNSLGEMLQAGDMSLAALPLHMAGLAWTPNMPDRRASIDSMPYDPDPRVQPMGNTRPTSRSDLPAHYVPDASDPQVAANTAANGGGGANNNNGGAATPPPAETAAFNRPPPPMPLEVTRRETLGQVTPIPTGNASPPTQPNAAGATTVVAPAGGVAALQQQTGGRRETRTSLGAEGIDFGNQPPPGAPRPASGAPATPTRTGTPPPTPKPVTLGRAGGSGYVIGGAPQTPAAAGGAATPEPARKTGSNYQVGPPPPLPGGGRPGTPNANATYVVPPPAPAPVAVATQPQPETTPTTNFMIPKPAAAAPNPEDLYSMSGLDEFTSFRATSTSAPPMPQLPPTLPPRKMTTDGGN